MRRVSRISSEECQPLGRRDLPRHKQAHEGLENCDEAVECRWREAEALKASEELMNTGREKICTLV